MFGLISPVPYTGASPFQYYVRPPGTTSPLQLSLAADTLLAQPDLPALQSYLQITPPSPTAWGDIIGSLSEQIDLTNELGRIEGLIPVAGVGGYQPFSSELAAFASNGSAYYLNRANHTGTQAQSTVVDLESDLAGKQPVSGISSGEWIANNPSGSGRWRLTAGEVDVDTDATVDFPHGTSGTVGVFSDSQGYPNLSSEVTGTLPLSSIAQLPGLSVLGRWTNSLDTMAAITAGSDGHVLRRSGTLLGFGTLAAGAFTDNTIAPARLTNGDALSVLGRSANSSGARADIAAASDHQVMRRSGTAVGFGAINLASVNAVTGSLPMANGGTGANLTDPNADRLLFWDDSAGAMTWLTLGTNLSITGTTLDAAGGGGLGGSTGSTDNAILRADGTGGGTVQSSSAFVTDTGGLRLGSSDGVLLRDGGEATGDPVQKGHLRLTTQDGYGTQLFGTGNWATVASIASGGGYASPSFPGRLNFTSTAAVLYGANNVVEVRNGVNPQVMRVMGTWTSDTNMEGIEFGHDGTASYIESVAGSGGGTVRPLEIRGAVIVMPNLPTSASGLPSGALWNDGGIVKVVP